MLEISDVVIPESVKYCNAFSSSEVLVSEFAFAKNINTKIPKDKITSAILQARPRVEVNIETPNLRKGLSDFLCLSPWWLLLNTTNLHSSGQVLQLSLINDVRSNACLQWYKCLIRIA